MFKSLLRDRLLLLLFFTGLIIKLFSLNEAWVEQYYSNGLYPLFSKGFRAVFGLIPFSVGDLLYVFAGLFLVLKTWKLVRLLAKRQVKEYLSHVLFRKYLKLVLWIYIIFNLAWGLNYNRLGIEHQLSLNLEATTQQDLYTLTALLHQRLNFYAAQADSIQRLELNSNRLLFSQAVKDYAGAATQYSFLTYQFPSLKASLYGNAGKYFAYTGYYNPFTGEAQIKTSIPVFLKPFVMNHEIAHQLGYAKENEASFVAFLTGKNSNNPHVRYSIYFNVFFDALRQFRSKEALPFVKDLRSSLHPRVLADLKTQYEYLYRNRNAIAPFMTEAYDRYLKMNNQPKGTATYNEVIRWMIGYMKKYGREAI